MPDDFEGWITLIALLLFVVFGIFGDPIKGSFVSNGKALEVARSEFGQNVEIESKSSWFVHWKGCDKTDVAIYRIAPFEQNGVVVDNAIVCAGWPFKGFTPRYK